MVLLPSSKLFRPFEIRDFKPARSLGLLLVALCAAEAALAGGPRFVAGVSYFNPAVLGQPVTWAAGQVSYFVDQGPLNSSIGHQQATAMVDAAAAIWSAVPTAAVTLTDMGPLAEDVHGSNVLASNSVFLQPADITPAATGTPVAVIFDADGSVIDALQGAGASQPDNCSQNGVLVWIDNVSPNATFAHGIILLNGRCATSANLLAMMSFQLERAFGRILGLDFSQVNTQLPAQSAAPLGWPIMQPASGLCGHAGGVCIPNPSTLRTDDIAALNRLYPVTAANLACFPKKVLTAPNTISIQGVITFRNGTGMQGVNVVARPLDSNGNPLYQFTATFVSGAYFAGNHGNPVTGFTDHSGNRLDQFGSNNPALQGYFDLSGIPLPPGLTTAAYQITFEAVNSQFIGQESVGPYILGSPAPSGTMPALTLNRITPGSVQTLAVTVPDSAAGQTSLPSLNIATAATPATMMRSAKLLPSSGSWTSRLAAIGRTDWFVLPVRGNRLFTIVTQALDATGSPTAAKAMPALGVWDGFDLVGSAAVGFAGALNGYAPGETWLQVATSGNDIVRLAVADQRGDGRPDYLYRGWLLYADTVSPARLPATGGTITIRGIGFHAGDTVTVGGIPATIVGILPNEITALVPPATSTTGSQDVEVDDLANFNALAVIPGGISYDSGDGDSLGLSAAPMNQVPMQVPLPFSVIAYENVNIPAANETVLYSVNAGSATLGCGKSICSVTTTGDGLATISVTATSTSLAVVTASLTNGATVQAQFYGVTPPAISSLTPTLHLAAGATALWPVQALALSAGKPVSGQQITWQSVSGITGSTSVATNAAGIAAATLVAGPLIEGQTATTQACFTGSTTCIPFSVFGARPEYASLTAVSGTQQSLPASGTPAAVTMRVLDMNGIALAGATVTVNQSLYAWAPPCPPHGRCAQPLLLSTQASTLTSALDGSITFAPLTKSGVTTRLTGIAATGNAGSLNFSVEMHP